ncbi:PGAP1-like protein [Musa troglodytarum]|uniref:PGAP1-like protein n=1 Tax=Musa troglodytarum TaxID=320322 RepID=A0A9E7GE90_9LILI|nr:PGAP1-like protein [Musa troglodytarum]
MFGDCGLRFPFLRRCIGGRRRRAAAAADLDPVVLVTGMGGSILNARNRKSGSIIRVWVRILLANFEFKKYLWSLYNPDTGCTESLNVDDEIVVPEDDYGLQAIDILDPSLWAKLMRLTDVYHFHDMIDMLIGCGYEKGTTLFGFGYDFRQSNRIDKTMDGLKQKLETAYKASGGKKDFSKYVNKWICIACPFQGAPGCIYDSLLTGLQFVYGFESFFFVSRWTMHQLLIECPSVYEMLPNSGFKWKKKPLIQVWRKLSEEKENVKLEEYDPATCISFFEEALKNNELKYNGKSISIPFNFSILKWAARTREIIDEAQLPRSVSFYNIFGTSFDSPYDVCYGSETSPIGDLSKPEYSYVDGDGTVPSESAKADGFAATARVGIKGSHRGLLNEEKVFQLLKQWLGVTERSRRHLSTSKVMDINPDVTLAQLSAKGCIMNIVEGREGCTISSNLPPSYFSGSGCLLQNKWRLWSEEENKKGFGTQPKKVDGLNAIFRRNNVTCRNKLRKQLRLF